jgi:DNA-binding CsgD family transcriptional regulator
MTVTPAAAPETIDLRTATDVGEMLADGRLYEARLLAEALLNADLTPDHASLELRATLLSLLVVVGEPIAAVAHAEAVLAERDVPEDVWAEAKMNRILGLLEQDDFAGGREAAEAMLAEGNVHGDAGLSGALTALALVAWQEGRVVDAVGLLRAAIQRIDSDGRVQGRLYPRISLALMLIAMGEFDEARCTTVEFEREVADATDALAAPAGPMLRARQHLAAGNIAAARVAARELESVAETPPGIVAIAQLTGAVAALHEGDVAAAKQLVQSYRAGPAVGRVVLGGALFTWVEAVVADAQSGPSRAVELLADVFANLALHKRLFLQEPTAAAWLVRAALAVGDVHKASSVAAFADALALDNRTCPALAAGANHARGVLEGDSNALRYAAARHHPPWARASAMEDAAHVSASEKDVAEARDTLEQAHAMYAEIGARRDVARCRAKLDRLDRQRAQRPAVYGWRALTGTERRVAEVVAEGLTNPEAGARLFLSRHTVDFHLRQIFRKLDIHSRVELTRIVVRLDGTTTPT